MAMNTLRRDAERALAVDIAWHARWAARRATAAFDLALADSGLSSTQFGLMCLIASTDDDSLSTLAQRAGLGQSTMSRNVDQLATAGLVEVVTAEPDRRRRAVWLTERGSRQLLAALPAWRKAQLALIKRAGADLPAQVLALSASLARGEIGTLSGASTDLPPAARR
jgi:DNA-binding MarR family transcriptional regulator